MQFLTRPKYRFLGDFMEEPEIIKKLEKDFFEHTETPAWDRFANALRKAYNLPAQKAEIEHLEDEIRSLKCLD